MAVRQCSRSGLSLPDNRELVKVNPGCLFNSPSVTFSKLENAVFPKSIDILQLHTPYQNHSHQKRTKLPLERRNKSIQAKCHSESSPRDQGGGGGWVVNGQTSLPQTLFSLSLSLALALPLRQAQRRESLDGVCGILNPNFDGNVNMVPHCSLDISLLNLRLDIGWEAFPRLHVLGNLLLW
ncbi:uncharacterized protein BP01DRAFT_37929 [Aspergillus saccharolyticus JOP 1030-1]|uniref:Uncharacterized protein n=1 Tax=Aspergillus saccharolyticus JOP 1030-1 TaxID=1450539 RepID=A0A318ZDY5_9EURO|nr:hypothetical protein BP01DRAFT_37929 [Aspergillus saccharolyticus JOP 1030-1]PYH45736.1 hypothetical protein BP01DRAFT_37929 [Aspergillus saccharolyticus JOP 1030-1]